MDGTRNFNTYRTLYMIKGILNLVGIIFFLIYAMIGSVASRAIDTAQALDPTAPELPVDPGQIFMVIGIVGAIIYGTVGTLLLIATRHWSQRTNRQFIQVAAGINCITGLLGILLCIFSLLELAKPEVKAVFEGTMDDGSEQQ